MQISKMPTSWPVARLMRGDENTCEIKMRVKRFADGVDLGGLAWMLAIKNAKGETDARHLAALETEEEIELSWIPGGVATKEAGETHVWISGFDGETKIWNSEKYKIEIADREEMPVPDETRNELTELQQLILYVDKELQGVIEAGRMAREAAQNPPQIGKNGNWYIYDAEKKEYVDSGKPSVGGGSGGGSGADGEDGGYYVPSVDEKTGELSWAASKADMPEATSANIKGPKGDRGEPGPKGDKGETGPQGPQGEPGADAETYILPPATADTLGGVIVGDGLEVDERGKVMVTPKNEPVLIETITTEKSVTTFYKTKEPDGTPYNFKKLVIKIKSPKLGTTANWILYPISETVDSTARVMIQGFPSTTQDYYGMFVCDITDGFMNFWGFKGSSIYSYTAIYSSHCSPGKGNISLIKIIAGNEIPEGTILEVWGVRA